MNFYSFIYLFFFFKNRVFNNSKYYLTSIWILEIILMASRKYFVKNLPNDKNIKTDLYEMLKNHINCVTLFSLQKIIVNNNN
jgi:hypothetical protein